MMEVLAILFMVVVAPIWIIFHYGTKARAKNSLTPDDEKMLEDVWKSAKVMERRIDALESVLDLDRERHTSARETARPASDRMM